MLPWWVWLHQDAEVFQRPIGVFEVVRERGRGRSVLFNNGNNICLVQHTCFTLDLKDNLIFEHYSY